MGILSQTKIISSAKLHYDTVIEFLLLSIINNNTNHLVEVESILLVLAKHEWIRSDTKSYLF